MRDELIHYLRRSACARVAVSVARQCQIAHVGLLTRAGMVKVLRSRWAISTVSHAILTLRRLGVRVTR